MPFESLEWWGNALIWAAVALIAISLVVLLVKFFTKIILFTLKKVILPLILFIIIAGVLFFVVIAVSDTYFDTSWWETTILPWFQGGIF